MIIIIIIIIIIINWTLTALQRRRSEAAKMKFWDLWQSTPFTTTKQMTTYAANYGLQAY